MVIQKFKDCNYKCDLGKKGRGRYRVYCQREKGCTQNGVSKPKPRAKPKVKKDKELWQMTVDEAIDTVLVPDQRVRIVVKEGNNYTFEKRKTKGGKWTHLIQTKVLKSRQASDMPNLIGDNQWQKRNHA